MYQQPHNPFISIVIPTRDRSQLVKYCLASIANQTFDDFEVIICDNFLLQSCFNEYRPYQKDPRFKYFHPECSLSMCDNWEFAISKAKGEYVTVISEKYLLRTDALTTLHHILQSKPAEMITWWHETFNIVHSPDNKLAGTYVPHYKPQKAEYFSAQNEIERRFSFEDVPYSRRLGPKECFGKIYSGCYHRDLIRRIQHQFGRVFSPAAPDLTSMIAALSLTKSCLDLGQPLMLACASPELSNGYQCMVNTLKFKSYLTSYTTLIEYCKTLPLDGLWVSLNNYIARDFIFIQNKSDNSKFKEVKLNRANLLALAKIDFQNIQEWQNPEEKSEAENQWNNLYDMLSDSNKKLVAEKIASKEWTKPCPLEIFFAGGAKTEMYQEKLSAKKRAKINWIENQVFRIKEEFLHYNNINEALQYFDEYYQESAKILKL